MKEALKLALEALEHINDRFDLESVAQDATTAITAIKEALAQTEQEVDWEKLYRLEVKKKDALAAKYEKDIKPLTKIVPMAQPPEPRNFCPRCGKRTADLTVIHTCTPPRGLEMT